MTVMLGAAVGLTWSATPAHATGSCSVTAPSRVVVDEPSELVRVTYGKDCVSSGAYARWEVQETFDGPRTYFWYSFEDGDGLTDYFKVNNFNPMGFWAI